MSTVKEIHLYHCREAQWVGLQSQTLVLLVALGFLWIGSVAPGNAQNTDPAQEPAATDSTETADKSPKTTEGDQQACLDYNKVVVRKVYNPRSNPSNEAGLNDIIVIEVENLDALQKMAKCQEPCNPSACQEQDIALFLDGRVIKGLKPESGAPVLEASAGAQGAKSGRLKYHLLRDAGSAQDRQDNGEQWADLLGLSSDLRDWSLTQPIEVSVGLANGYPVPTDIKDNNKFSLLRIRPYRLLFWIGITLACAGFLFWLARRKDLLCDRAPVLWGQRRPYSLSAVQAAWWFLLILISFIFIWLVTGEANFSGTALTLLGISLGTALGATVIDVNKKGTSGASEDGQANSDELNLLLSDKEKLEKELSSLRGQPGFADKKVEYDNKISEIKKKFPNAIGPAREKFYLDILSDANGVSFHRFQMLVWTVVLGIFFISATLGKLAMPDFSSTLLTLMGISAGTYLGFKIPENNNVPTQPTTPATQPSTDEPGPAEPGKGEEKKEDTPPEKS